MRYYAELYSQMRFADRQRLRYSAYRGNENSKEQLFNINNQLKAEVNERIRTLKSRGLDYNKRFNEIYNFGEINIGKERLATAKELDYDVNRIFEQMELALKFLNDPRTELNYALKKEQENYTKFRDKFDSKLSLRQFRQFVRFLSNEETLAILEEHGSSEKVVEMFYDIYSESTSKKRALTLIQKLELEFLSNRASQAEKGGAIIPMSEFDEALAKEFNIDLDKYRKSRYKRR